MREFVRRTEMPCSADELFAWHLRPGAFLRLAPPWDRVRIAHWEPPSAVGRRAIIQMRLAPFIWKNWVAEYREYEPGRMFRDVQVSGPFALFDHRHLMIPAGEHQSVLEDRIEYAPPLGALGQFCAGGFVLRSLRSLFAYRHRTTYDDLEAHARAKTPPLHVLVTGSTGLVGSTLVGLLTTGGHCVTRLARGTIRSDEPSLAWADLEARATQDAAHPNQASRPFDAVVHLAGENIAARRWTTARKEQIRSSRSEGTRRLCELIARLPHRPSTLVCASAVGIYGDRGDEFLTEESDPGDDFLAQVCRDWEQATQPARDAGIRVVHLRFGVILSARGGMLARLLPPFRLGLGGRVGNGRQYLSWVAIDDAAGAIHHALVHPTLVGPVNVVAPEASTNSEFTRALGQVLHRPTLFPLPATAARLAFGELADALLLAGQRVLPQRLAASGYRFRYPRLEEALRFQLGRCDAD